MNNKIQLEIILKDVMKQEKTPAASSLKYQLIMDLINKQIDYIGIINYYYDIINLNNKQED